jgi:hypothetical protein
MNIADFRAKIYPLYVLAKKSIGSPLHLPYNYEGQKASDKIRSLLSAKNTSCMISRLGIVELRPIIAYLNMHQSNIFLKTKSILRLEPFYYSKKIKKTIQNNAGFFPNENKYIEKFAKKYLNDIKEIDVLGTFSPGEFKLLNFFENKMNTIPFSNLEPYNHNQPWTTALKGKKVLVIHPFAKTIKDQYKKRELLFKNQDLLPEFKLKTIKAVQSIAGNRTEFTTWFEALDYLYKKIDSTDFDIAIIGAGCYGLPLAAHIKKKGRKAIQLGGATQIMFGIKGKRWDRWEFYQNMYNEHWVRPLEEETPKNIKVVECGTYW